MRLLLTMDRSCGDVELVELIVGFAMRVRAPGALVREWNAPVATGVMPAEEWR